MNLHYYYLQTPGTLAFWIKIKFNVVIVFILFCFLFLLIRRKTWEPLLEQGREPTTKLNLHIINDVKDGPYQARSKAKTAEGA